MARDRPSPEGEVPDHTVSENTHARSSRRPLLRVQHDIETASRRLIEPDLDTLATAVEDIHRLTTMLADLVDLLTEHAPRAFDGDGDHIRDELVRDLNATHGCLTTAGLLIAPAVDDLRELRHSTIGVPGNGRSTGNRTESHANLPEPQLPAIAIIDGDACDETNLTANVTLGASRDGGPDTQPSGRR